MCQIRTWSVPFVVLLMKTLAHSLFSCPIVSLVWSECYSWLNLSSSIPATVLEHYCQHVLYKCSPITNWIWRVLWCAITWVVWNWRNNIIFNRDKFFHDIILVLVMVEIIWTKFHFLISTSACISHQI